VTDTSQTTKKIKTAVVTGRHPFDVPAFHTLFRSLPGIDFYPQHLEDFVTDAGKVRDWYDVVVFYNFHQETPGDVQGWYEKAAKESLERLGETRQGILLLHHALLAFKGSPLWSELTGVQERTFGFFMNQSLRVHVANAEHPITRGLSDWDMVDETYTMADAMPVDGNTILLTVDHPQSMKTLAWTRQYRNARVFCWQSGHDGQTFANPHFRTVMARGIEWLAGQI
jgi:type 1 glutamine amidotransferase